MRWWKTLPAVLLTASSALGVEESDVLLFAPFEDTAKATVSAGDADPSLAGPQRFGDGVRGKAVVVEPQTVLSYAFKGNCVPDEGSVMMWVKPEWESDDGKFHHLFRASTGNFRGKALNALMLYEYSAFDRLIFYSSDDREIGPQEGRSMAYREPLAWEPGRWYHVAATWSATLASTEQTLYIDGQRVAAASGAVFVPVKPPERIEIGGPRGTGATWFDDLIVFSRPLLASEVASVYESYSNVHDADPSALPFVSSRELQLRPYVLFGRGQLVVEVDYRGARRELSRQSGKVELTIAKNGRQWTAGEAADPNVGAARFTFPVDEIGGGACRLSATLRDSSGRTLRPGSLDYTVPHKPVWLGNDLGKTGEVLPPWTPLSVDGDTVRMWGREYVFRDSPLPTQIVTQGEPLLRSAIRLSAAVQGREVSLQSARDAGFAGSEAEVRGSWSSSLGPLTCRASGSIEFDGLLRVDLELRPEKDGEIDALELVIPLAANAALYHHANGTWTELSDAGGIGDPAWRKPLPFVPYVWIGSERGGLAWFCESNGNWRNSADDRAVEIVRTENGVDLRIRFIDVTTTLSEPLSLSFGFMATPVKPMPGDWRDWRPCFISALNLQAFAKRGPRVEGCRNIGALWNTHVGAFSYLPPNPSEMREKVRLLKDNGWETVLSYFALNYTQTGTPEYQQMEREWRRNPYGESGSSFGSYGAVCNASTWADFLVWAIDKTMDETGTDGVYLDCCNPNFCRSSEHGCATGGYPLVATRDLMKRIYTLVRRKRGPAGFVYAHNSENNLITTFSFTDAVLNGEQYNRKDLRSLTFEKFRAELSPQPYGVPALLLPTLVKFQPEGNEKMAGAEFLAFPLLHDVICTPSWLGKESQDLLRTILKEMHEFGVADAEFLPYWDNASELAVSPAEVRVSAYLRRDGKALLLIAAAEQPADAVITFRGRLVALGGATARDPLAGDSLRWNGSALVWPIPDRRVRTAVVSFKPRQE